MAHTITLQPTATQASGCPSWYVCHFDDEPSPGPFLRKCEIRPDFSPLQPGSEHSPGHPFVPRSLGSRFGTAPSAIQKDIPGYAATIVRASPDSMLDKWVHIPVHATACMQRGWAIGIVRIRNLNIWDNTESSSFRIRRFLQNIASMPV